MHSQPATNLQMLIRHYCASVLLCVATLLLVLPDLSTAQEKDSLQTAISRWIAPEHWQPLDVDQRLEQLREQLGSNAGTVFWPDADMGPLSKVLRLLLAEFPATTSVRYRIRYTRVDPAAAGTDAEGLSLIEIARFDLRVAQQKALRAIYPEARPPSAEPLTEPVDKAWRLLTRPLMGQIAEISYIGWRELDSGQAERCWAASCREAESVNHDVRVWPQPVVSGALAEGPAEVAVLEAALQQLYILQRDGKGVLQWQGIEWPELLSPGETLLEIVLERGLGQEDSVDAVIHIEPVMDHEIRALWQRSMAIPGVVPEVFVSEAHERVVYP